MNQNPPDIRDAVAQAVWRNEIITRLDEIFQASGEVAKLRELYDESMPLDLQISSSLKYTRVKMPNVRNLPKHIRAYLVGVANFDNINENKCHETIELCFTRIYKIGHISHFGKPYQL